jgi:hypothetical protein
MKHTIAVILLAAAPLSWGEKSFFCTIERQAWLDEAEEFAHPINDQLVISATAQTLTVKVHTPGKKGMIGDRKIKVLSYSDERVVAGNHKPARGEFSTWIIDAKRGTVVSSELVFLGVQTQFGTCTEL